jgi:hypothetical protein
MRSSVSFRVRVAKKDSNPEDRDKVIALLRDRQDVRELIQFLEAKRRERPSGA